MRLHAVLRTLILSDLFILGSFGLVQPIFAVFLFKDIVGVTVTSVGIAATIQLFVKATFQILVAKWADDEAGNCRELYALVAGSFVISLVPIGYAFAHSIEHIYIIQFFYGLGQALSYPSWRVIFTRYLNQDHAGYEWGMYDTVVSFGVAAAASLGAYFADQYSFASLFLFVSALSFMGTAFLVYIFQQEFTCRIPLHRHRQRVPQVNVPK